MNANPCFGVSGSVIRPESELAQELTSRAAPRVEAHHRVNGPDTGINSRGRRTIKKAKMSNTVSIQLSYMSGN